MAENPDPLQILIDLTVDRLLADGDWPEIHGLRLEYARDGGRENLTYRAYNIPGDLGRVDGTTHRLHLKVRALKLCPKAARLLEDYIKAVHLAVARFLEVDDAAISSTDLGGLVDEDPRRVLLLGRLIQEENTLWWRWPTNWPDAPVGISEDALRYRDIETIDDYLVVRDGYLTPLLQSANPIVHEDPSEWVTRLPSNDVMLSVADLHPAIKEACEGLFAGHHHQQAVQAAAIALRDLVRKASGLSDLDGDDLMGAAFGRTPPPIQVGDPRTESGRNRQKGARLLAQGVVAALRNPLSHDRVEIGQAEAMESVGVMSLLARWIHAQTPSSEGGDGE